jgi:hypothetical protein
MGISLTVPQESGHERLMCPGNRILLGNDKGQAISAHDNLDPKCLVKMSEEDRSVVPDGTIPIL